MNPPHKPSLLVRIREGIALSRQRLAAKLRVFRQNIPRYRAKAGSVIKKCWQKARQFTNHLRMSIYQTFVRLAEFFYRLVANAIRWGALVVFVILGATLVFDFFTNVFPSLPFPSLPLGIRSALFAVSKWTFNRGEFFLVLVGSLLAWFWESDRQKQRKQEQDRTIAEQIRDLKPPEDSNLNSYHRLFERIWQLYSQDRQKEKMEKLKARCHALYYENDGFRPLFRSLGRDIVRVRVGPVPQRVLKCLTYLCDSDMQELFRTAYEDTGADDKSTSHPWRLFQSVLTVFEGDFSKKEEKPSVEGKEKPDPGLSSENSADGLVDSLAALGGYYSGDVYELLAGTIRLLLEHKKHRIVHELLKDEFMRSAARHAQLKPLLENDSEIYNLVAPQPPSWPQVLRNPMYKEGKIRNWLDMMGFRHHPFGTETPAEDPLLVSGWVPPEGWDGFLRQRAARARLPSWGDALYVAHYFPHSQEVSARRLFPVFAEFVDGKLTVKSLSGAGVRAASKKWSEFLANSPERIHELSEWEQRNIAFMGAWVASGSVTHWLDELASLRKLLCATENEAEVKSGLQREESQVHFQWLCWRMETLVRGSSPSPRYDEIQSFLAWLNLRPPGLDRTVLSVVLDSEDVLEALVNAADLWYALKKAGVEIKILSSRPLASTPMRFTSSNLKALLLRWSEQDLNSILDLRCQAAVSSFDKNLKDFAGLFRIPAAPSAWEKFRELRGVIVTASDGSLARLLELGRNLVDRHVATWDPAQDPEILLETLEEFVENLGS